MASLKRLETCNPNVVVVVVVVVISAMGMSFGSVWSADVPSPAPSPPPPPPAQTTNPADLRALHEMMSAMYWEYDWATNVPDPCVASPQGIVCEADPDTGVLYVTQLQFGFISPTANIIPCSANASIPPSTLASFTRLTSLAFRSCFTNRTTTLPLSLPSLGPSLRFLFFTRNPSLTGPIPNLSSLSGLERLILSQNSLTGPIPGELANLLALTQLDLSHNNLSGEIPPPIGTMSSLVNLDLRFNSLSGSFPSDLAQGGRNLQRLALSHNRITAELPDAFFGLKALTFLDLTSNELTGSLPPSLTRLNQLEDLFLNGNRFNGVVPEALSNLTSLVRLDLSSCGFVGAVPDSLQRLRKLRYLSVSNNQLSGELPASLALLPVIFTLGLDGNRFSGQVPFSAAFVERMGRNLQLKENAALCYSPELKVLLPNLQECPLSALRPVAITSESPPSSSLHPSTGVVITASPSTLVAAQLITIWTTLLYFLLASS